MTLNLFTDERDDFKVGYSFFQDEYFDLAEQNLLEFLSKYKNSIYEKKVIFYLGLSFLEQKKYKEALNTLAKLKDDKSFEYADDIDYYLSLLYAQNNDYNNSLKSIEKVLKNEKDQTKIEKIIFLSIQNYIKLNNPKIALQKSKEYFENSSFTIYKNEI
ncbi:MAG TPA: hypothetical protein PK771_10790, partial [Spirochaetota bacterium]|nr:hypothetical protein [Spirochaetota bacterium]